MTSILSIQSHVAYGHAGNSAAVFPLQRLGVQVWPVLTVNFSNHTGYGAWRGPLVSPSDVAAVVQGIDERGQLAHVDALLTGYQGDPAIGQVVLDAAQLIKQRNPQSVWCCDPVMGDVGRGFYCRPGIPEFMRDHVVPASDIVTPNLFELEWLTGRTITTPAQAVEAAHALRELGPSTVLVTSVTDPEASDDVMRMIAVDADGAWVCETPVINRSFTGSGDVTSAMFLAHLLETGSAERALAATASIVYSLLKHTDEMGSDELELVSGQANLVEPAHRFEATRIA